MSSLGFPGIAVAGAMFVYIGMRCGWFAKRSTAALLAAMGPVARWEKIMLWAMVGTTLGWGMWKLFLG